MIDTMKPLTDNFWVGTQPSVADVDMLKAEGFDMIINNRPDGEEEGQPSSLELHDAARKAGLAYAHVPVQRGIGPSEVEGEVEALDQASGKTYAFCRSGTRSTLAWAVARSKQGADVGELKAAAEQAGYNLQPVEHLL